MPQKMYDDFSPEPVLKDSAPGFFRESAKTIGQVEKDSGKVAILGGMSGKGERSSSGALAPKYTWQSPAPSARAKQRKELVDQYVRREIEPVLAAATSYLLLKDPQDIRGALLTHFLEVQSGKGEEVKSAMISSVGGGIDPNASAKRKDLLRRADGMITKLARMIVIAKPDDIVGFIVEKLQSWSAADLDDDNVDAPTGEDVEGLK